MHTGNGEITYFRNKTEFGYDYTALMPIMNSAGESVAILAVDISVNEIRTVLTQYIISIVVVMCILIGVFLAGLYKWLSKESHCSDFPNTNSGGEVCGKQSRTAKSRQYTI